MEIHAPLAPDPIIQLGPLVITNAMLTSVVVIAIICLIAWLGTRKMRLVPGRYQSMLEMIVEFLLDLSENTAGKRIGRRVFPLIATFFIYILLANWISLFPGFGEAITVAPLKSAGEAVARVPLLRAANSDLNMTAAMALLSITVVQFMGLMVNGVRGYLKHLATPWFLTPVHLISELSHIISLAARLFGNIFGGEVLITVMYGLVPLLVPTVFLGLEVLFGFIQALIFTVLSIVYISLATAGTHAIEPEAEVAAAH
jgi:F-type H+-transporting ATPase subunit a